MVYLQALPIFLDKLFHPFVAVVLSVTFVLAFGEVCVFFLESSIFRYLKYDINLCLGNI